MPAWYAELRSPILLIQSAIGVFVFAYSLKRRRHFWLLFLLGLTLGCGLLYTMRFILFPAMSNTVNSVGRIILSASVYLALILLCWFIYDESLWTALFVAASGFIAQDMGGTLKTLLKAVPSVNNLCASSLGILLVDLVAYYGFYVILYFAFRPYTQNREENFSNRTKAVFSFITLLFGLCMTRITQGNPARNEIAVLAESLYQVLCGVFILLLQFGVMERAKLSRNVDMMRELVHQQHEQFCQAQESTALVNEKYHDLKGLLEGFQGRISQEQIDQLTEKVAEYDTLVDTGNRVLDVVLAEKRAVCAHRDIELTAFVNGKLLAFMEELDLYSLIGNALNNAIDAVSNLPAGERFITLTAAGSGGMVTIHMENPYSGEVVVEGRLPKSQRDARYHGFGMRSMERITEKYGGSLAVTLKDQIFYLDIILFQPEDSP